MEDTLISYDTAILAKQKQVTIPSCEVYVTCDRDVYGYHPHKKEDILLFKKGDIKSIDIHDTQPYNTIIGNVCTQTLLSKILRERYKILVEVRPIDSWETWTYDIYLVDIMSSFFKVYRPLFEYDNYEHALEMGLQEGLKYVK
jgi:hypothetical protein